MIAFDLVDERLKLFLNNFGRGFLGRRVAIARVARSIPTILYIDRLESGDDLVSCFTDVDLG